MGFFAMVGALVAELRGMKSGRAKRICVRRPGCTRPDAEET